MLTELSSSFYKPFHTFCPYPTASHREAWNSLDREWQESAIKLAESYLHFEYPHLSATDFLDFSRTGNRVRYENRYFIKRYALNALVLAECVENKGRFMDDIVNGIFSICEESAWQLPPHNTYVRDMPQLPLPDASAPVLELFACETGAVLATTAYLLSKKLDEVSPFITKRIRFELSHRIFTPYINYHFWWMGNGKEPMNNWTIWCTENVLITAFFANTDEELQRKIFEKACKSADYFLAEYGEDGCCDEGAQYYRHAGLCLFGALEVLNTVTNGHFASLYEEPKIKNMAAYIMNVHIQDKYYLNFADCSPVAGRSGTKEYLFAKRTGNTQMMYFAATDFLAGKKDTLMLPNESNLYYRLQNAFTVSEIKELALSSHAPVTYPDIYYPSVGVFIARDEHLYLAVKAGDNDDSHNHNDTGSFTVYKNGKPLLIDVGVESYTKKTFSPQRYEIWTMQSAYHNLPTINGQMQQDGADYCAREVTYSFTDDICRIQMELASTYPASSALASYIRSATLIKDKEIVIHDTFSFNKPTDNTVLLSLMTYEFPQTEERNGVLYCRIGDLGNLQVAGGRLFTVETLPVTDARLGICWKHEIYRILISADSSKLTLHIS